MSLNLKLSVSLQLSGTKAEQLSAEQRQPATVAVISTSTTCIDVQTGSFQLLEQLAGKFLACLRWLNHLQDVSRLINRDSAVHPRASAGRYLAHASGAAQRRAWPGASDMLKSSENSSLDQFQRTIDGNFLPFFFLFSFYSKVVLPCLTVACCRGLQLASQQKRISNNAQVSLALIISTNNDLEDTNSALKSSTCVCATDPTPPPRGAANYILGL